MQEQRIEQINAVPIRVPLKARWRLDPAVGKSVSEMVVVQILCSSGLSGVGEASGTARWSGETALGAASMIETVLAPVLLGQDALDIETVEKSMERVCKHNWFARAALEMACWDVKGQAANLPVHRLLGDAARPPEIPTRFSIGPCSPRRAEELAGEMAAAGLTTFKVKVGGAIADDVARVRAVERGIGSPGEIVLDATGGWSADDAIEALHALDGCPISMVEQPTVAGDYAAMARVRAETGRQIIADDGCFDKVQVHELIRNRCCDALSLYPGKNGGIRKSLDIAAVATENGLRCTIGSNMELDIGTAAAAQLARGVDAFDLAAIPGDLRGPDFYETAFVTTPAVIAGPTTTVGDGPGLGVKVDWSEVRAYALPNYQGSVWLS